MNAQRCPGFVFALLFWSGLATAQYDDGARYAFVGSVSAKTIYIVDLQDPGLPHALELELAPDSVVASEQLKALVIAHVAEQRLTLIDLRADDLPQMQYELDMTPGYVAVSPTGESVLVYDADTGRLEVHELRRREVLLAADGVHATSEPVFSADGLSIYWSDDADGTFNSIDLWSARSSIKLSDAEARLSPASRSIDGGLAFVSDAAANAVHIIDLPHFALLTSIGVGSQPGRPWGTTDGQYMLVPNRGDGTVTALSTLSGKPQYTVPGGKQPVSIHPGWLDTTAAVVGASGQITFLDIQSGERLAQFELEGVTHAGVVTSDSRTLAVPLQNGDSGGIALFDMRHRSATGVISHLAADLGPVSLAVSNNLCH
jgi:DNA-binding beta-propeller fold protein YncE